MLERLSKKIGITKTEIKIIVFIVSVFVFGFIYKTFFIRTEEEPFKIYDYSEEDEKFLNAQTDSLESIAGSENYKNEVLDFESKEFKEYTKKTAPKEKSININIASVSELTNLPGIGEKTAQRIIDYRNQIKRFTSINQLLNVKGIGNSKFDKLKNYIYIN